MTSRQNKARSKKKTTADAAVFVVMRRAQQCRPHAVCRRAIVTRASRSKARLRLVTNRRDSWRSHVHRTYIAQRVQFFELQTANVRGQGARPLAFSWGFKGDILSRERIFPLSRAAPAALLPLPHSAGVSSILLINRQPKRQFDTKLLSPLSLLLVFSASFIIVRRHAEQR